MSPLFSLAIDPILFKLAGNSYLHNILDESIFRPDCTSDNIVALERLKLPLYTYNLENGVSTFSRLLLT